IRSGAEGSGNAEATRVVPTPPVLSFIGWRAVPTLKKGIALRPHKRNARFACPGAGNIFQKTGAQGVGERMEPDAVRRDHILDHPEQGDRFGRTIVLDAVDIIGAEFGAYAVKRHIAMVM